MALTKDLVLFVFRQFDSSKRTILAVNRWQQKLSSKPGEEKRDLFLEAGAYPL
jgi:hypothetical protein